MPFANNQKQAIQTKELNVDDTTTKKQDKEMQD